MSKKDILSIPHHGFRQGQLPSAPAARTGAPAVPPQLRAAAAAPVGSGTDLPLIGVEYDLGEAGHVAASASVRDLFHYEVRFRIILEVLLCILPEAAFQDPLPEILQRQHPAADEDVLMPSAGFAFHGVTHTHVQAPMSVFFLICSITLSILFSNIQSRCTMDIYDIITFVCN